MEQTEKLVPRLIRELPRQVADKIAAGEVVDRPLSIVKELLENAIDAGADSIAIEIKNGGKSYIRVTDNGCGIPEEQVLLAFKRHATSKIQDAADLDAIETLGFRGEALASIAAVSKTELITKTADAKTGTKVRMQGGEVAENTAFGCPDGTTIVVTDLFYNTPARLKFLKADHTESTLVIDLVSKMALAYPSIRIRLINNGSILFSTPGKGDTYANILTIYSKEIGRQLIHVTETDPTGFVLEAYISAPQQSRTNRKHQIFFVNGRYVESKVMTQAIASAYAEKLFDGRHPIAFLFLTVMPNRLDVNIHPNKKQVRFDDEPAIRDFIVNSLRSGLLTPQAIPEITSKAGTAPKKSTMFKLPEKDGNGAEPAKKQAEEQVDIRKLLQEKRALADREWSVQTSKNQLKQAAASSKLPQSKPKADFPRTVTPEKIEQPSVAAPHSNVEKAEKEEKAELVREKAETTEIIKETAEIAETVKETASDSGYRCQPIVVEAPSQPPFDVGSIRIIGAVFNTYILGSDEKNLYLIDQHAAHERIFYERLLQEFYGEEKPSQVLMLPYVTEVSFAVKNDAYSWLDCLLQMGYRIEEFGLKSYVVKEIPFYMSMDESKEFLDYFLDNMEEKTDLLDPQKLNRIITRACKSAVKAHDRLDLSEIRQLMDDLAKTKNPFSCPHGRPTFIRFSQYEIEKMFKRV